VPCVMARYCPARGDRGTRRCLMRILLVRHEVQSADAQHAHRPGNVELGEYLRVPEDLGRPAQIAEHDTDAAALPEQRLAM
jgi:hypothetical protein